MTPMATIASHPYAWPWNGALRPDNTALIVIDMQTDFCGRGGYVDAMGYDIGLTRAPIGPIGRVLAAMRAGGTITPAMMEHDRFKDADVLALMAKCTIELPDEFADLAPETRCCRLTATLNDGRTVVAETRRSLDDDVADPGWDQAVDKFNALTAPLLDAKTRAQLLAWVDAMETQSEVGGLVELTRLK